MFAGQTVGEIALRMRKGGVDMLFLLQVHSGHSACGACAVLAISLFLHSFPQRSIYSVQPVLLPNIHGFGFSD